MTDVETFALFCIVDLLWLLVIIRAIGGPTPRGNQAKTDGVNQWAA